MELKPVAFHKAAPIPLHWQDKVISDLKRDEALGVIERVPIGEPVGWCHRMVVTRKQDGTPRRTVDLSPLNKHCKRETHNSESPFHLARRVPRDTWKTVTDAWNGYHSVPLRETDRHLTTFTTPFGRWRYARAPQGFLSSGDGYNRRFDSILADFTRKERIVDDTIHYDTDLQEHWWRTIDFLSLVGKAGIVLNSQKFQFAQREVDFAGFRITQEKIDPLPKFYNAIRDFPTPTSTTDIRSWFGLVNQVANYAQLRSHMAPFRPFLSPRYPFEWNPDLDAAFRLSKSAIVEAIREGVEIFDLQRPTCLRTDWSKRGVGYFLLQKHCHCEPTTVPDCCPNGWRITLAGSRFLSSAEQRYAPIEGEALAVAWSLEQTKFFTLGCHHLIIATDHKPLTKLFGDRTLDEIPNTRLFRLKQRTLPWSFNIIHLPGNTNMAADATSRYPAGDVAGMTRNDIAEPIIAAAISRDAESLTSFTWEQISAATKNDTGMMALLQAIHQGFPDASRSIPPVSLYWQYRYALHESEGVIIYEDRVVIPPSLRPGILQTLHSAHQGISAMGARARSIIFWPGMTEDINKIRRNCISCNRNAPSQAPLPTTPTIPPSTPFEKVFADFFDCVGQHYLVIGDRLSGWCDIFRSPHGTPQAGAEGLITCLRNYFARFGVPEEISSDGGPEFTSKATESFLSRWGVIHRLSSAYYPQSNGRAEVAVKSAKRLLQSNTGLSGTLNTDNFLRAMMQLRNTPDPDCNISPAQIVFGRPLRDAFTFSNRLEKFSNNNVRTVWRNAWQMKEEALRQRFHHSAESLNEHSRPLPALKPGDRCYIQNQTGNYPKRWDRSGTVVEAHDHNSYTVKVDGTGRVTRRNRKFLRHYMPASSNITKHTPDLRFKIDPSTAPTTVTPPPQIDDSSSPDCTVTYKLNHLTPPAHFASAPLAPITPVATDPPIEPTKVTEPIEGTATTQVTRSMKVAPTDTVTPISSPTIDPPAPSDKVQLSHRPNRKTRPPAKYEPETGHWI